MNPRLTVTVAAAAGVTATAVCVAVTVSAGRPAAMLPITLAIGWWAVGLVALAARPDHASARLLTAFGLLHLLGFTISTLVSDVAPERGWWTWVGALVASLLYDVGFAVLAILLATFPTQRMRWTWASVLAVVVSIATAVVGALTTSPLPLPVGVSRDTVAAPVPLPLGRPLDLAPVLPLLVLVALVMLVRRTVRAQGDQRRQLLWPAAVTSVLVVLIVATPAGTHLLGRWWALVFVLIAFGLPLALLAGLQRYRLLQVELYAARTLGYVGVLVVVIAVYAGVAALVGRHGVAAAVLVAVVAAFTGSPLQSWLESRIDRFLSGGRLRGHAVIRHLAESLESTDAAHLAARTAETIATALDVSWVEVVSGSATARFGRERQGPPELTIPLQANGASLGSLACGPRRSGWSADDVRLLELLARHAGLALHGAELSAALARQVAELTASRVRLVRAEDETRRRIERDLHDGIQQQVVVLLGRLGLLRSQLDETASSALAEQSQVLAQRVLEELRRLAHGIHPPLLTDRGLVAAVEARADLLTLPVVVDADPRLEQRRLPADIEAAAYYAVCEAITNVIKHSGATNLRIVLSPLDPAGLQVAVVDDGVGFTATGGVDGSGLRGLRDRVEAVGGTLQVTSPEGVGTTVLVRFPQRVLAGA